ncbi:oxidoreductase [Acaryochloris marina]|uniref:Short chain dehydrogenase family protein n=1 Tax=Acaryochloris marina (strain MBIC 11017) TaxID=329726 RepID=A8ZKC8_ACAM1|nr:oxidoreductase [Acaryochloris marina]ABW31628.1 short chain dehydrogenase family protein [Acaryochloris marina MBIC11017]
MEQKISNSGFSDWKPSQLLDLTGKTYVITGANSGIGFEAAKMLSEKGGDIVMVCRSRTKAEAAQRKLVAHAQGKVDLVLMDLSDLSSVRKAAQELRGRYQKIDALINNAGIMMTPQEKTVDGFDLQMGANHLGHFLWTGLLLDLVEAAEGRIVVLSSLAHKFDSLDLDDFMSDTKYTPIKAYAQSKLSNLMFAFELDRRLKDAGSKAICIACHPGYTSTNLQSTGPTGFSKFIMAIMNKLVAQRIDAGATPTVLAAAGVEAQRGAYYGPQKMNEYRGPVSDAKVQDHALDRENQRQLWAKSEQLVGFQYSLPVVVNAA